MDEREALYTAARRYCQEATPLPFRWSQRLPAEEYRNRSRIPRPGETADYAILQARSAMLATLLDAIEDTTPSAFASADDLRAFLLDIANTAQFSWPSYTFTPCERHAIDGEREKFRHSIAGLTGEELRAVTPLPYHRELTVRESERLWSRLRRHWGVVRGVTWYPLSDREMPSNVIAFQEAWFAWEVPLEALRRMLASRRVRRVWQLPDIRVMNGYELDVALLIPWGYETYWTSEKLDWILYSSHEYSLTVGGEWLINLIKDAWPGWERHLYAGWEYPRPPYDSKG